MHLNRLRLAPQKPNILLERLRLPKRHVRLYTRPSDCKNSRLALHAFVLNFFVRDTIRSTQIPRHRSVSLQPLARLRRVTLPVFDRLAFAVVSHDLCHRRLQRLPQLPLRLKVDVHDIHRPSHDGRAALQMRRVGVRGDERFVVAARVPVEEHLEDGGVLDLRAEVRGAETGLLAEGAGDGG